MGFQSKNDMKDILYFLLITLFVPYVLWMRRRAKKRFAKSQQKNEENKSPKLLYLRAFITDGSGQEIQPNILFPLAGQVGSQIFSYEQSVISFFINKFQVITVGRPGEEPPDFGCKRIYFTDDEWKIGVFNEIKECAMILYRPATSDSTLWEFEQIILNGFTDKLLIWTEIGDLPEFNIKKIRYENFRKIILERYNIRLPNYRRYHKYLYFKNNSELAWSDRPLDLMSRNTQIDPSHKLGIANSEAEHWSNQQQ
jgi:hypothetical protein